MIKIVGPYKSTLSGNKVPDGATPLICWREHIGTNQLLAKIYYDKKDCSYTVVIDNKTRYLRIQALNEAKNILDDCLILSEYKILSQDEFDKLRILI